MMKLPFNAGQRWTPEEDDRLHRLAKEGRSAAVIAERMKRSVESIKSRAHGLGISLKQIPKGNNYRILKMQIENKTAFQLEEMIADLTGFNPTAIDVKKLGSAGNFTAAFVGKVAAVSKSRAQADVDAACGQLKHGFKLKG